MEVIPPTRVERTRRRLIFLAKDFSIHVIKNALVIKNVVVVPTFAQSENCLFSRELRFNFANVHRALFLSRTRTDICLAGGKSCAKIRARPFLAWGESEKYYLRCMGERWAQTFLICTPP